MSASLADSAGRLLAWRIGVGQASSPLAKSDWQPDIRFSHAPQLTIGQRYLEA